MEAKLLSVDQRLGSGRREGVVATRSITFIILTWRRLELLFWHLGGKLEEKAPIKGREIRGQKINEVVGSRKRCGNQPCAGVGGKEVSAPPRPSSLMEPVPRCSMPLRFCESQAGAAVLRSVFF